MSFWTTWLYIRNTCYACTKHTICINQTICIIPQLLLKAHLYLKQNKIYIYLFSKIRSKTWTQHCLPVTPIYLKQCCPQASQWNKLNSEMSSLQDKTALINFLMNRSAYSTNVWRIYYRKQITLVSKPGENLEN